MMAREAGKMAAQNVIKENPKIFKAYTPFPVNTVLLLSLLLLLLLEFTGWC